MTLFNTKSLIAIGLCVLAIYLIIAMAAARPFSATAYHDPKDFFREGAEPGYVDPSLCMKLQTILKVKDPCRWSLDSGRNILKLYIGDRVAGSIEYVKYKYLELDERVQDALNRLVPETKSALGYISGYVEIDPELRNSNIGLGSFIMQRADSLLQPGTQRIWLDMMGWIQRGKNIPSDATILLKSIYYAVTQ